MFGLIGFENNWDAMPFFQRGVKNNILVVFMCDFDLSGGMIGLFVKLFDSLFWAVLL